jgi:EAL domain-containing protein (putative c-di-GMP-specific phosphodiesterase class I)/CHASE2 domain-containing sensor protein
MDGDARKLGVVKRLWRRPRLRLLFWAVLATFALGAIDFARTVEDSLRLARNAARQHAASGDIVLVAIDDRSLDQLEKWPWPRHYHGQLTDRLREAGANRVFFDIDFSSASDPQEDEALAAGLARMKGRATLALRFVIDPVTGARTDNFPTPRFRKAAQLANINFRYTGAGAVWDVPYALSYAGRDYPSFAAALAGSFGPTNQMFPIDYSIDPRTIPVVSAVDVIAGRVPAAALNGKDVIIGTTSLQLGDISLLPGHGRMAGVYVHIFGAETLKQGQPVLLGWLLPFLAGLALAAACLFAGRVRNSIAIFVAGTALLLFAPLMLEARNIHAQVAPALILLIVTGASQGWQKFRASWRERANTNAISGLPNLTALREQAIADERILIAARVQNYPEVCATLPAKDERALVEQIASRLTVGAPDIALYQGDEGIFAWTVPSGMDSQLEAHLEALHSLFRSPVVVAGNPFDLALTFGIDAGRDRSAANRLGGALVAADEAAHESLRWKRYDPSRPEEAAWKLSILSQLDAAIEANDLWVAYQPMFEVAGRTMIGAEALVRWTHPQKGAIAPMEFIPAAEQNGRIEKLTEFVLDRAIRAAAQIRRRGIEFNLSVNLSPKLLGRFPLEAVVVDLLGQHGLPPECLTLEVTETAALATGAADLEPLHALRARGVRISIDDYGTGLSTLDYVKRIPANEIKIDKSFVQSIHKGNSDRLMVHSTIQLAHSLGQSVVAEGVEDLSTLETLASMDCDVVQGFYLAKPMTFKELIKMLIASRQSRAA